MPTPVFPNAYRVLVKGTLYTVPVENVWTVQGPDPFDATVAADIAATFQTRYVDILSPLSQDLTIEEIEVTNLGGVATGQYILSISPFMEGGTAQPGLPGSVAFCVTLRSALAGRRFRGRKYFSGLCEPDVTGNTYSSTAAGALQAAVEDLRADLATNGTPMSVFSTVGLTLVPVTTISVTDLRVDSQRGRLR